MMFMICFALEYLLYVNMQQTQSTLLFKQEKEICFHKTSVTKVLESFLKESTTQREPITSVEDCLSIDI